MPDGPLPMVTEFLGNSILCDNLMQANGSEILKPCYTDQCIRLADKEEKKKTFYYNYFGG